MLGWSFLTTGGVTFEKDEQMWTIGFKPPYPGAIVSFPSGCPEASSAVAGMSDAQCPKVPLRLAERKRMSQGYTGNARFCDRKTADYFFAGWIFRYQSTGNGERMNGGPKVRKCKSPGSATKERSPGCRWMEDVALQGRYSRALTALSIPFRAASFRQRNTGLRSFVALPGLLHYRACSPRFVPLPTSS